VLILSRHDVEALLDLDALVDALSSAMAGLSAGRVSMPARIAALVPEQDGLLAAMPAYLHDSKALAVKLVSVFPRNEKHGLASHQALIAVFDSATGALLAVMDGTAITAARTAAGSALATRLLARPEASVLAILGTGVQARAHARAIPRVRKIAEIRVMGRNSAKAEELAAEIAAELRIPARVVGSAEEGARGAEIICATTHSAEPVVCGAWLERGTHVNSVGLNPQGRELDGEAIKKSLVVVESRAAALAPFPSGSNDLAWAIRDGLISKEHIHAEVGELVSGARPGRTSPGQITLYKSVGVAVQDAAAAQLVLEAARRGGVGREIEI
jgi:ornithine cyclodeaminase/alanine dehydrogenase-like protein (mu-crystallin family)